MNNNFNKVMSSKSDSQLMAILTRERDQFQPEALMAAEDELRKRNLSIAHVENIKRENDIKSEKDADKAEAPLEIGCKILGFFIPGLIPVIFSGTFKADGYSRKARELGRWTAYGFAFYMGLVIIVKTVDR